MTQDTFSVIFLEYRIRKYEHFLKVTFHSFAAHLKDYFSARSNLTYSNDGTLNFTLWKDGSVALFSDNDLDANVVADICGKIWNKKKKLYHGKRTYKANKAIRCYRDTHNNVDIHNQLCAYGNWDYRTRRKQMRVPMCQITYFNHLV